MSLIQYCLMQVNQSKISELLRYIVAGVIALLVHLFVLYVLVENFRLDETFASGVGFICATSVNYTLQKLFVFKSSAALVSSLVIYCAVTVSTLLLNLILFWTLNSMTSLHYLSAQIVTIIIIFILNYYLNRNVTFKRH